jgi:HNH endonuclease
VKSASRQEIERRVRALAGNRCGYCLSPQQLVLGLLEIEHLLPSSLGGTDDEENLWLACRMCNNFKSAHVSALDPQSNRFVPLFNPRRCVWNVHFQWSDDGKRIVGKTDRGRATVIALQLNNIVAVTVRANWIIAGWHPSKD